MADDQTEVRTWARIDADEGAPFLSIARSGQAAERVELSLLATLRLGMEALQAVLGVLARYPEASRGTAEAEPEPFIGQMGE